MSDLKIPEILLQSKLPYQYEDDFGDQDGIIAHAETLREFLRRSDRAIKAKDQLLAQAVEVIEGIVGSAIASGERSMDVVDTYIENAEKFLASINGEVE